MRKLKAVRSATVDNSDLNLRPKYVDSVANNPHQTRLTRKIDVKNNVFKIESTSPVFMVELSGTPFVETTGSIIIVHNLGYAPLVMGSYKVVESDNFEMPVDQRGLIPEYRVFDLLLAAIQGTVSARVSANSDVSTEITFTTRNSGAMVGTVQGQVWFFREVTAEL